MTLVLLRWALNSGFKHCDGHKGTSEFSCPPKPSTYISPSNPYASYIFLFQDVDNHLDILSSRVFQLEKEILESSFRNICLANWPIGITLHTLTEDISQIKSHYGSSR
jgi:hypothetical protein